MTSAITAADLVSLQYALASRRAGRGDLAGTKRHAAAARNLELTEHWHQTGWHSRGALARDPQDPQGRGWHDAHLPCKTPDTH